MNFSDLWLLTKKIAVGVAITTVPLAIIVGGLWVTQHFNSHAGHAEQASSKEVTYAN
jgi:hypothetical protein